MSLHFARKPKRVRRRVQIALGLLVLAVVAVRLASAAPEGSTTRGLPAFEGSDPGLVHVHGIGVDPRNDGLYKAAHTGLLRIDRRGNASRVANRYQDTMGFTVLGGGHFFASGHPDLRERQLVTLAEPVDLIESTDAGRTWTPRSLSGEANFHE